MNADRRPRRRRYKPALVADPEGLSRQLADGIAAYLFVNGNGDKADRMVLLAKDGRDLGGWCQEAIADAIERVCLAAFAAVRRAADPSGEPPARV